MFALEKEKFVMTGDPASDFATQLHSFFNARQGKSCPNFTLANKTASKESLNNLLRRNRPLAHTKRERERGGGGCGEGEGEREREGGEKE